MTYSMWLPVRGVPVSTFSVSNVFSRLNLLIELVLMMGRCEEARMFLKLCLKKIDNLKIKVGLVPRDCWHWLDCNTREFKIATLRSDDSDGHGNTTKAIGLISKTTILHVHHAFLYISLPSLHDYDVKMPNFTMYRGSTQATTRFPLSF